jgi:hypothetical protein
MREHAMDIGALAIEQMTTQIKEEQRIKQELQDTVYKAPESESTEKDEKKKTRRKKEVTTPRGRSVGQGRPTTRQKDENEGEEGERTFRLPPRSLSGLVSDLTYVAAVGIFQRVGVTFTPVYKCIHIYENLASLTEFENYYQYTRQVRPSLHAPALRKLCTS